MSKSLDLKVILAARDKITGPLKKINATSSGTARALKQAQAETKQLKTAQRDISSFRKMDKALKENSAALNASQERVRQLGHALKTTKGPTTKLRNEYNKARKDVEKFTQKGQEQRKELNQVRKRLKEASINTRNLADEERRLDERMKVVNERIQRQKKHLNQLGKADISGKFGNMTSEVSRFGRKALMVTGGAAAGIFGVANSTASLGDEVAKTGDKIGIALGPFQELRYAAERSGVPIQKFDSSLERFVKRMGEATQGTGAARKAYDELGLSAEDLSKMTPEDSLAVVADRLSSVENQSQRVALAAQLFGREGVAMVNMMKDGSAGLQALRRDARATGYVLSEKAARDAETFKDAMLDAQLGMAGMKNTIGAELMPAVTDLMGELSSWMSENRDRVKAFSREFGQRLKQAIPVIRDIAVGVWSAVRAIGSATASVAGLVGGFDNLAVIMAAVFAMKPVLAILAFGKSLFIAGKALAGFAGAFPIVQAALLKTTLLTKGLWFGVKAFIPKAAAAIFAFSKGVVAASAVAGKALWAFTAGLAKMGVALLTNPIVLIITGVAAAIAGAAYLIYKNWDGIAGWFSDRWSDIKQAWSEGLSGIGKLLINWSPVGLLYKGFSALMSWLGVDMPANLTDAGGKMIAGLVSGIRTAAGTVFSVLSGLWGQIKGAFSEGIAGVGKLILNWSPLGLFYKAFSGVLSWFGVDLPQSFTGFGKQILDGLVGGIMGGLNKVKDTITNAGQNTIGWFKDVLGIKSPSRVFMGAGRDTLEGYRRGLVQQEPKALKQVNTFGKRVRQVGAGIAIGASTLPAAADNVQFDSRPPITGPVSAAQQPAGDTITININAAQGQSAQEIAAEVDRILQARDRRKATRARSALYDRD